MSFGDVNVGLVVSNPRLAERHGSNPGAHLAEVAPTILQALDIERRTEVGGGRAHAGACRSVRQTRLGSERTIYPEGPRFCGALFVLQPVRLERLRIKGLCGTAMAGCAFAAPPGRLAPTYSTGCHKVFVWL